MIATAAELFQRDGYHGTSWRGLVEAAGTPWGSAHHYFPGGKDELAVATIAYDAEEIAAFIGKCFARCDDPADAIEAWFAAAAKTLRRSGYRLGCRVATVTLETVPDSPTITAAIRAAFDGWQRILVEQLVGSGLTKPAATQLALLALVSLEGALILARVRRDVDPLQLTGAHIAALVRSSRQERLSE